MAKSQMKMRSFALLNLVIVGITMTSVSRAAPPEARPLQAQESAPLEFSYDEIFAHQQGTHRPIRLVSEAVNALSDFVKLDVVVAPDGSVKSAAPTEGVEAAYSKAVTEVMTWRYTPFEKDGIPATVHIEVFVMVLPPEDLPTVHHSFPVVNDPTHVVMTLSRSGCYGFCPSYSVEIHGDGSTMFKGENFVVFAGEHHERLSPGQIDEIVDAFRKADYFSLKDEYTCNVTDNPTYKTSFEVNGVSKQVTDYVGAAIGMPQAVTDLEATIDRVLGTAKWIRGNSETIAALKNENWDFKSDEAGGALAAAAGKGNAVLVRELIAQGVSVSTKGEHGASALAAAAFANDRATVEMLIQADAARGDVELKTAALAAAAEKGDVEMTRQLLAYGGDPKGAWREAYTGKTVLMCATASGRPEIVEMILATRPDINERDEQGQTALWGATYGGDIVDAKHVQNRPEVVHSLARAGANLNAQDANGDTALHTALMDTVVAALIHDGATVNIRNNNHQTPLMTIYSAASAKLMVEAGADVDARDAEGMTALDIVLKQQPSGEKVRYLQELIAARQKKTLPESTARP
jgi:ankyrin repeat protein